MHCYALKMLIGDRTKYIGIIIGLTFAVRLITQRSAIFAGMMARNFSLLVDVGLQDFSWWVRR
jgi:putative ABC transport system permease protein